MGLKYEVVKRIIGSKIQKEPEEMKKHLYCLKL